MIALAVQADPIESLKLTDVSLASTDGPPINLISKKGPKATVVVFTSIDCPLSNGYLATVNKLREEYESKGVTFFLLNPNEGQSLPAMEHHRKDYQVTAPVLKDAGGRLAREWEVTHCPEACLFDAQGSLRYRGRIDDRYQRRGGPARDVSRHDLRLALDEVLAGRTVTIATTEPVGCPIFAKVTKSPNPSSSVTYHKQVSRLLQQHCQECHRGNGGGPFALTTYDQALSWSADIEDYTARNLMPPWKPVPGSGEFLHPRGLSAEEKGFISQWIKDGCPEGDPKDAPAARVFPEGWANGTPDIVLSPPEAFELEADGPDVYRNFVFKTNFDEDVFIRSYEVLPSNRKIVHHVLLFIDQRGIAEKLDERDPKPGYESANLVGLPGFIPTTMIGGWAPGNSPHNYTEGCALVIPKGASVVIQIHYSKTGKPEKDQTKVGLYRAPNAPKRAFAALPIEPLYGRIGLFAIPAGMRDYKVKANVVIPYDLMLINITPHMHLIGRDMKVTATTPEGKTISLIQIDDWDFNWQETYFYKKPLILRAGTKIEMVATYDNSDRNPNNPNRPPQRVVYGEQTKEEMCICFLGAAPYKEATTVAELFSPSLESLYESQFHQLRKGFFPRAKVASAPR